MRVISLATTLLAMAFTIFAAPTKDVNEVDNMDNGVAAVETGTASHYSPNIGAGACGAVWPNEAMVAGLPLAKYMALPASWPSPNCGKKVKVTRSDSTASVVVEIVDACRKCLEEGYEDVVIDLSEGAFKVLDSDLGKGRIPVYWDWA